MNNFKKFVAVLMGVVMACVFATSAFAADVQNVKKAQDELKSYLASKGITSVDRTIESLDAAQLTYIRDNQSALAASLEATKSAIDNNNATAANEAAKTAQNMLASVGVSVTGEVKMEDGKAVAVASVSNTKAPNAAKDVVTKNVGSTSGSTTSNGTDASNAASNAAKNSAAASSVKTVSSAANPITASSSAVIKATGDNSAVVFVAAALAVAGVLGMAVRKERAL